MSSPSLASPFCVYHFSLDLYQGASTRAAGRSSASAPDFLSFLAIAINLGVPLLPITWQAAGEGIGFCGCGEIRQAILDVRTSLAFKLVKGEDKGRGQLGCIF